MELLVSIFLIVTLCSLGVLHFLPHLSQRGKARIRQRIKEEFHANQPKDAPKLLFKDVNALSLSSAEEYAFLGPRKGEWLRPSLLGLRNGVDHWLHEAGVSLRPGRILLLAAAAAAALGLAGAWLFRWPGGLAGFAGGAAVPVVWVYCKRQARREKFVNQLPKAFELMARVIRAGQSVPQSFQAVGEAFEEPLAGEFARCQQQQSLGLSPEVVLQETAKRCGVLEFRIFVMALLIQRQVGGNLSEVLDRLAALIRGRLRLRQQVRTLTAEGRLQGTALVVMPFVLFAVLLCLNRAYALELLNHPALLGGTAALMAVGVLWIRNIVNLEA